MFFFLSYNYSHLKSIPKVFNLEQKILLCEILPCDMLPCDILWKYICIQNRFRSASFGCLLLFIHLCSFETICLEKNLTL